MVKDSERLEIYLQWILDAIDKIKLHVSKINIEDLEKYPTSVDASLMQLIHIWETANKIKKYYPKCSIIPEWVIKLRNFAAHDYIGVNINIVKSVIRDRLPELKSTIKTYLKSK